MTMEKYGPQSGWVVDQHSSNPTADGMVWRYGTERACNLVGRYVTIFADYSAIAKPFEIALCQFGVLGNRIPIPDEVPFPPTFSEKPKPSIVQLGRDQSWVLPEIIIGSVALVEVGFEPDYLLTDFIDYDAEKRTFSFFGADASTKLHEGFYKIKITLIDENNLNSEYTQQVIVQKAQLPSPLEPEKQEKSSDEAIDSSPLEDNTEKPNETFTTSKS